MKRRKTERKRTESENESTSTGGSVNYYSIKKKLESEKVRGIRQVRDGSRPYQYHQQSRALPYEPTNHLPTKVSSKKKKVITAWPTDARNGTYDSVSNGVEDEDLPQDGKDDEASEANTLGEATSHEQGSDGCEHHHEESISRSRDVGGKLAAVMVSDINKETISKVTDDATIVIGENKGVAKEIPHKSEDSQATKYLHDDTHCVLSSQQT